MADVAEGLVPPPAVDQSGNLTIWWVPTIADVSAPKAATEIGAVGSQRITYNFTPSGWALAGSQEKNPDDRLTLKQSLESLGKSATTLVLDYVDSTDTKSAAAILTEGLSGYFVERRGIPNSALAAAAQKVRVIPVTLGKQLPGSVDGTGKFSIHQEVAVTGVVGAPVALAA